jgi:nucleoside-diphosphate-sugar epimerase
VTEIGRVVVLGGSRLIGRAIVEALLRKGYDVVTVNRGRTPVAYSGPVRRIVADREEPAAYARALGRIDADYLVDVTAYRPEETAAVLESFRGRIRKAVHISTLSVYRSPLPFPVPETWPLETDPANGYGFRKAECERLLLAETPDRFPCAILRLPFVYGPGDPQSRESYYHQRLLGSRPIYVPVRGFRCQNLFSEDAARACLHLLEVPCTSGRAYNAGGPAFTLEGYLSCMSRRIGKVPNMVRASADAIASGGGDANDLPYFFESDLVLDTGRIRGEAGFRPAVSLRRGLSRTLSAIEEFR